LLLAEFPAGARPGTALHAILEHVDFGADAAALERECAEQLARYGIDAERWAAPLAGALFAALHTPLDASGLKLASLSRGDRVDELEFLLPVHGEARLTARRLSRCLRDVGAPAADPAYAGRVEALGFAPLSGFLKGFVDLVFRVDGRYYLIDYKSNWLGGAARDYAPARLVAPMAEHHYFLQYHLYTVALHRHLTQRLHGYDYDRDFGGVFYLFLRGMAPQHAAGTGVFHDRPTLALVQALSDALGREVAS
jgi:exodeoxyribonuclease V beta subunit